MVVMRVALLAVAIYSLPVSPKHHLGLTWPSLLCYHACHDLPCACLPVPAYMACTYSIFMLSLLPSFYMCFLSCALHFLLNSGRGARRLLLSMHTLLNTEHPPSSGTLAGPHRLRPSSSPSCRQPVTVGSARALYLYCCKSKTVCARRGDARRWPFAFKTPRAVAQYKHALSAGRLYSAAGAPQT